MKTESYRELKVLEEFAADSNLTQRHLAKKLEVALGLTNLMIRRLVKKGYVKAVSLRQNRIRYLITPKGITEKTRLTYEYLEYSLHLYRRVREVLSERLREVSRRGGTNVIFFGTGEVAEIAFLTLKELGLNLVGVIDDQAAGGSFLGLPILRSEATPHLSFDCGIISSLNNGLDGLKRRLHALGVPGHKLIVIEQNGAAIRAVLQGLDG